jgi:Transglutaminase-like superfamily/IPT/TIG domain
MNKNVILYHIIPGALFAALILLFSLSVVISKTAPVILSLEPARVSPGDAMVVKGRNFGISRGKVFLDRTPLTASFVESWSENMIKLRVPPINSSGLISIETGGGRSDGALFVLSDRVPDLAAGAFLPGKPFLSGINNSSFKPGDLVILKGDKMGSRKKDSRILVSIAEEAAADLLDVPVEEHFLAVPEDHIYSWQNDGLSFFLPQEAESGPVYLHTASGFSNPVNIEVMQPEGLDVSGSHKIHISQEIEISHIAALPGNSLALWVPVPENRMGQELLSPAAEEGHLLLEELKSADTLILKNEYELIISSVSYELNQSDIPREYNNLSMLEPWLKDTETIPASDFRKTALTVVKREKHPLKKASLLFDYVLWKLNPDLENPEKEVGMWLKSKKTDSLGYASLYVSLCRSVGVPARVVSGVWYSAEAEKGVSHHWAELYLPDCGWFPVDTAAADSLLEFAGGGADTGGFGHLDASYISFSRGEQIYSPLTDSNRISSHASYSRQTAYAEWMGNLESCSINWKDIAIMIPGTL